MSVLYTLPSFR